MKNKDQIKYTINHRKAFRKVEKELLGHNTVRSLFHDLDKVFLYMVFDHEKVHNWHRYHIIDMKSIMGMLSFALPTDVDIVIRADGDIEKEFYEHVKRIAS